MESKIAKYLPLLASVAIHLGALGTAIYVSYTHYKNQSNYVVSKPVTFHVKLIKRPPTLEMVPVREDELGIIRREEIPRLINPDSALELIEEKVEEIKDKPEEEKIASLEESLAKSGYVKSSSIDEMFEWLNLRGYTAAMKIYDIERKEFSDGNGYKVIFIDRDMGMVGLDVLPDEVNEDWDKLYRFYEMGKRDEKFKKLIDLTIAVIEKMIDKKEANQPQN